jgi:hypothetical protein
VGNVRNFIRMRDEDTRSTVDAQLGKDLLNPARLRSRRHEAA